MFEFLKKGSDKNGRKPSASQRAQKSKSAAKKQAKSAKSARSRRLNNQDRF